MEKIGRLEVSFAPYQPMSPSSYVPTPSFIQKTEVVINNKNENELCFQWSFLAKFYAAKNNINNTCNYQKYLNSVKVNGLKFSLAVTEIKKFEKLNPSISVTVLTYNAWIHCIYPDYVTKRKQHDISALLCHRSKKKTAHYCCDYCLYGFKQRTFWTIHVGDSTQNGVLKVTMPNRKGDMLIYYKAIERQLRFRSS